MVNAANEKNDEIRYFFLATFVPERSLNPNNETRAMRLEAHAAHTAHHIFVVLAHIISPPLHRIGQDRVCLYN